ncbi:MAG: hypothetical protein WBL31_13135 [Ilumatobacteraceae bacterium]|jgi:hypothetical protein
MFIQSAELTAAPGKSGALGPMVTKMRDLLSSETGKQWWSWAALAGRPFGTQLLSTRADGFADMVATQMKLIGSEAWAALSPEADGVLAGPAETYLAEVIAMTGEPTEPKQMTTVTRATIAGKDLAQSIAWSCAAMERATKVTGQVGTVATSAAGNMFQVYWFAGSDTAEDLDTAREKMNSDAEYQGMIAQAGADGLFVDGSVEEMVLFRMP